MDMEYLGNDLKNEEKENIQACAIFAHETTEALFWTYDTKTKICYLKDFNDDRRDDTADRVSGSTECGISFGQFYDYKVSGECLPKGRKEKKTLFLLY